MIEGIPDGYQVCDIDLSPSARISCVLTNLADDRAEPCLLLDNIVLPFPVEAIWRRVSSPFTVSPLVRFSDEDHLVAVKPIEDEARRPARGS